MDGEPKRASKAGELKRRICDEYPETHERYFEVLGRYLAHRLTKPEFDTFSRHFFGPNISIHNQYVFELVHEAQQMDLSEGEGSLLDNNYRTRSMATDSVSFTAGELSELHKQASTKFAELPPRFLSKISNEEIQRLCAQHPHLAAFFNPYNYALSSHSRMVPSPNDIRIRLSKIAVEFGMTDPIDDESVTLVLGALKDHLLNLTSETLAKTKSIVAGPVSRFAEPSAHAERSILTRNDMCLSTHIAPYLLVDPESMLLTWNM